MKHILAAILLSLAMLPNVASAWVSGTFTVANFSYPIEVSISDEASGGCWTNLGEAKTYATDKLRNAGFQIAGEYTPVYFNITVLSERMPNGACYGDIVVELMFWTVSDEQRGPLLLASHAGIFVHPTNANTEVLDYIKEIIDEMPRK